MFLVLHFSRTTTVQFYEIYLNGYFVGLGLLHYCIDINFCVFYHDRQSLRVFD